LERERALPLEALRRRRGRCHQRRSVAGGGRQRRGLYHSVAGGDAATGGAPSLEGAAAGECRHRRGLWHWRHSIAGGAIIGEGAIVGGGRHQRVLCHWRCSIVEGGHHRRGAIAGGGADTRAAPSPEGARSALERDERKTAGGGRCSIQNPKSVVIYSILVNGPAVGV